MDSTEYSRLTTVEEGGKPATRSSHTTTSWKVYPGDRRIAVSSPSKSHHFIKTGGNALQAISLAVLQQQKSLIAVSVPEGVNQGDVLLVKIPETDGGGTDHDHRVVEAIVPPGCLPGHTFLVKVSDPEQQNSMDDVVVAEGIPFDSSVRSGRGDTTQIVVGHDIIQEADLTFSQEAKEDESPQEEVELTTSSQTTTHNRSAASTSPPQQQQNAATTVATTTSPTRPTETNQEDDFILV